ncbi:hypothetical protein DUI87_06674 [Hirundo rustica rustica]|uniref:Zinc finger and BTB domain-containing protein 7C n=1 Tax=Hirundo rustica rustica TaxID=333673 RepID=A0A3M0LAR9_HIRRU|nr:hypothetical protein DUI87_06674 [Hirundo rustica rustica]
MGGPLRIARIAQAGLNLSHKFLPREELRVENLAMALNENMANGIEDLIGIPFPNHSSEVLCGLNEQRHDGLLCDVILIVQDQEYRTHRSVLAACSKYFKKLFTTGTLTDQPYVYEIDFVKPEALSAILEFAYTSTLTITTSNVKHILSAAKMLEIQSIINVCLEIMEPDREAEEEDDKEDDDDDEDEDEDEEEEEEEEEVEDFVNQENLADVQEANIPERRPALSPFAPSFFPHLWNGDFNSFSQLEEPQVDNGPLDLVIKKRKIKEEEEREDVPPPPFPNDFFKDMFANTPAAPLGHIKAETDYSAYLNFLSATQFGGVFPPWPLEEERKIKPKASQQCPICNKVIMGAGKLPRHMRTHTGEKPYMCNICEVRFTRQDKLKIHMRKHTGERPYLCIHCNAKFVHNYDLKNHMRIHTGIRPYHPKHFLGGAKAPFSLQELESQIEETQMKLFSRAQMDMERNAGIFAFALGHNESLAAQPFFPLPDPWSTGFSGLAGLGHVAPISEASN